MQAFILWEDRDNDDRPVGQEMEIIKDCTYAKLQEKLRQKPKKRNSKFVSLKRVCVQFELH